MSRNIELVHCAGADALAQTAAQRWLDLAETARQAKTKFNVALSGGRIAGIFFSALLTQARQRSSQLDHVQFFWSDERCVPPTDTASNFLLAARNFLEPLHIGANAIHRLRGELSPVAAVEAATKEILASIERRKDGMPILDLVLLGLGEDGHIASLFPGEPDAVANDPALFRAVVASKPPPHRLTMSYSLIAAAGEVWVLASGSGKETALAESLRDGGQTPCARLLQMRKTTTIFTDIALSAI